MAKSKILSAHMLVLTGAFFIVLLLLTRAARTAPVPPIREFKVGVSPQRVVLSKDEHLLYVANSGDNSVSAVDVRVGKAINITVRTRPSDLALSPDGRMLYVVNSDDASLSIVDTVSHAVTDTLRLPRAQRSSYISVFPHHGHLFAYVSNVYATPAIPQRLPAGSISVVDLTAKQIVATIDTAPEAAALGCAEGNAITPDGRWLFVNTQCRAYADFAEDPIYVIDTEPNVAVYKIDFTEKKLSNVGTSLAVRPDGKQLWAGGGDACSANWDTYKKARAHCGAPGGNPVTVIDTSSRSIIRQLFYGSPAFITFSPDSKLAYLATEKEILAIDTGTFGVAKHLPIAGASGSIALTKDGRYAYAVVTSRNTVVRVDLKE